MEENNGNITNEVNDNKETTKKRGLVPVIIASIIIVIIYAAFILFLFFPVFFNDSSNNTTILEVYKTSEGLGKKSNKFGEQPELIAKIKANSVDAVIRGYVANQYVIFSDGKLRYYDVKNETYGVISKHSGRLLKEYLKEDVNGEQVAFTENEYFVYYGDTYKVYDFKTKKNVDTKANQLYYQPTFIKGNVIAFIPSSSRKTHIIYDIVSRKVFNTSIRNKEYDYSALAIRDQNEDLYGIAFCQLYYRDALSCDGNNFNGIYNLEQNKVIYNNYHFSSYSMDSNGKIKYLGLDGNNKYNLASPTIEKMYYSFDSDSKIKVCTYEYDHSECYKDSEFIFNIDRLVWLDDNYKMLFDTKDYGKYVPLSIMKNDSKIYFTYEKDGKYYLTDTNDLDVLLGDALDGEPEYASINLNGNDYTISACDDNHKRKIYIYHFGDDSVTTEIYEGCNGTD